MRGLFYLPARNLVSLAVSAVIDYMRCQQTLTIESLIGRMLAMHPITDYFRDDVLAKRPYLKIEWRLSAIAKPIRRETQSADGRTPGRG